MSRFGRTIAAAVALAGWSCSSTQPDATPPVADIVVNPATSTLAINAQLPLQALVRNEAGELIPDASVTWTVENPNVASVSTAGVVTALAVGSTQVAASARGKSGIATVTVQRTPVASVVVLPDRVSTNVGNTTQLTAKAYDAAQNELTDRAMIWTTSNAGVATVDNNGLVTAKGKGTATVTATAEGKSDASEITVSPGAVSKVSIIPSSFSMVTGEKRQLEASALDASGAVLTGKPVQWASNNLQVVTVSDGEVTAVGGGAASITATVDGVSGSAAVSVSFGPVATVSISPASDRIVQNAQTSLTAATEDASGNRLTDRAIAWQTSDDRVAALSATSGQSVTVTGVVAGTATITATSEGKSSTATITVTQGAVSTVSVTVEKNQIQSNETTIARAVVLDANQKPLQGRSVSWNASGAATVSPSNSTTSVGANSAATTTVKGKNVTSSQNATITASISGKSGSVVITVSR